MTSRLDRQRRLKYIARGPEFAIAVPDHDLEALGEVVRSCSDFWNGPGTLLLPTQPDGTVSDRYDYLLEALPPDQVYFHRSLSGPAERSLADRWPGRVGRWGEAVREQEVHPIRLLTSPTDSLERLDLPEFADPLMRVVRDLTCGALHADVVGELQRWFAFDSPEGDAALLAVFRNQVSGMSPLSWARRFMRFVEGTTFSESKHLFVFPRSPEYVDLVDFWNLRARLPSFMDEPALVGVPVQAFELEGIDAVLREWMMVPPLGVKPDVSIEVYADDVEIVEAALRKAGFNKDETGKETIFSSVPADREAPEYALRRCRTPGRLRRGMRTEALTALAEGDNELDVDPPTGFPPRFEWAGFMRFEIHGLPLALPVVGPLARTCLTNGFEADDGVAILTQATRRRLRLPLRIPSPEVQLERYAEHLSLEMRPSGAGALADTLIGRLPSRSGLDALAHPSALPLLSGLYPTSRLKLAKRVRHELSSLDPPIEVDEERLVDLLRDQGLFLETKARTLAEVAQTAGAQPAELVSALGPLCDAGFVQRGRRVQCPQCQLSDFWALRELDEHLRCRACQNRFPLPATEGPVEAQTAYRLDGLMARIMDQDLVPVLLTVRHLLQRSQATLDAVYFPGLDLFEPQTRDPFAEVDILLADGGRLQIAECKSRAEAVTAALAAEHIALAARLGGVPVLAASDGEFPADIYELQEKHKLLVLEPAVLRDG
jgi:hypothetical protein